METFVKASAGAGSSVIYETDDGQKVRFEGGHRNWRNQNPGNIRSNGIKWLGKIGEAGGFCVFASPEYGLRAMRKILSNRAREGKTLEQAIAHYAPSVENNVEAYVRSVVQRSGIARDVQLAGLSEAQMERIVMAMCAHEGGMVGTIRPI